MLYQIELLHIPLSRMSRALPIRQFGTSRGGQVNGDHHRPSTVTDLFERTVDVRVAITGWPSKGKSSFSDKTARLLDDSAPQDGNTHVRIRMSPLNKVCVCVCRH